MKKLGIGKSDFKGLIESGCYFVDKTPLLAEVVNEGSDVILITRPRRFGKTLNLSMLECFFDIEGKGKGLFEGLKISKMEEFKEQGKYPVVSLSLKDLGADSYEMFLKGISSLMSTLYFRYKDILDSLDKERILYQEIENVMQKRGDKQELIDSLANLVRYLNMYYNQKVVVLIDEYDVPIHYGWLKGYYTEVIDFMRPFLSKVLKDNPILHKAVLTGCLRVSRESIFTGLNNLTVAGIMSRKFADKFGFTPAECRQMLRDYEMEDRYDEVMDWYNGYNFEGHEILNPWSVLNYIDEGKPGAYWSNTSGNDLVKQLIKQGVSDVKENISGLLAGEPIKSVINENISFPELKTREDAVYSLLLFSGYLKCERQWMKEEDWYCKLVIPNREVRKIYRDIISGWLSEGYGNKKLRQMCQALVKGEIEVFEEYLQDFVVTTLSYFDPDREEPEALYLGFIAGMLLNLSPEYVVKTNRESGLGRYDVMVKPVNKNKRAIIMELKSVQRTRHKDPEKAIKEAFEQIEKKRYEKELRVEGYKDIMKMVIMTDKKEVWVEVKD